MALISCVQSKDSYNSKDNMCYPVFGDIVKVLEKIVLLLLVVVTLFSTDMRATKILVDIDNCR